MELLIFITCLIALALFYYEISKAVLREKKFITRLNRYTSIEEIREERKRTPKREYKKGLDIIAKRIGNAKFLDGYKRSIQARLIRAHMLLKAEEFITVCLILLVIMGVLLFAISRSAFIGAAGAIFGWLLPSVFLKSRIKKRLKFLNDQLCDAIILISNSLKAGYSFFQSIDIVAKEMTGPIAEEFAMLQKEINLGLTTEKALENLVNRVKSDDLELVVTAVLIQRQVGGNLAEVLDNISSTIRERIRIKGEVKTVTAQGRMSGLIISLLPLVIGSILFLINPEHISLLFKEPLGIAIVIFSIFMELTGIYFINKIIKIEI